MTTTDIQGTEISYSQVEVGDRLWITAGTPGRRPALVEATVTTIDPAVMIVHRAIDGPLSIRIPRAHVITIIRKPHTTACDSFQGTGTRCTDCRYRKDFH